MNAVFLQNARAIEFYTTVESRLPTKGEKDAIGTLFGDDTLDEIGRNRLEINLVGNTFGGLHGSDIGVDEHCGNSLFAKGFECLRTRIIELARLTDFQGTGA